MLRRISQVNYIIRNIKEHLEVLDARKELLRFSSKLMDNPYKYVEHYLSRNLTPESRRDILIFHNRFIVKYFKPRTLSVIPPGFEILARPCDLGVLRVSVSAVDKIYHREGDFSLNKTLNGKKLATLDFSFAPGSIFGFEDKAILFIGRIQAAGRDLTRAVSRCNGEILPTSTLLLGAQALAISIGIKRILAVTAENQVCNNDDAQFKKSYDEFWESNGGFRTPGGFFELPEGPVDRWNPETSSSHRARARRKRALKNQLIEAMIARIKSEHLNPLGPRVPEDFSLESGPVGEELEEEALLAGGSVGGLEALGDELAVGGQVGGAGQGRKL
jgi:uncharacterized protein VirK/YbjX